MSIKLWPLVRRIELIKKLSEINSNNGQQLLEFQNTVSQFDIHHVEIGFPCYRLSNGRTLAAQKEIVAKKNLDENFFITDPDSDEALERQDKILRNMVSVGSDSRLCKIFMQSQQVEALILDNEGYVINGNRRLCVMRLLYEENPTAYAHFDHVKVIFLPPCSQNDIDELETKLQWRPSGRAEYGWVSKAINLRERHKNGWSPEKIASLHEIDKKDVILLIAMLDDAEEYLRSRGMQYEYSYIEKSEMAFQQLQKGRKACENDEAKKALFTQLSYNLMDDVNATGRRLYERIPDILKYIDDISLQLQRDLKLEGNAKKLALTTNTDILGEQLKTPFNDVLELVQKEGKSQNIRNIVLDKLEEKRKKARELKDTMYCLRETRKANTCLQNTRNNLGSDSVTAGILSALDNIETNSKKIRKTLANE